MEPFKMGHYTDLQRGTGCTVILCPDGTMASACARGVSPGTREFALLSPYRKVEQVHAVLLTGGSAFGLEAAGGVMQYLTEMGKGYHTPYRKIPIVPAAVIYDLPVLDPLAYPTAEHAYQACKSATITDARQGTVGAGTGATIGKWAGLEYMMKGGMGRARLEMQNVWVETLSVVNPVGDVVDSRGNIVAGAQQSGKYLAQDDPTLRWKYIEMDFGRNTILSVIMTNALLSKMQLYYLAERSHNGMVRAVIPAHTSYDGDIIFTLATGAVQVKIDLLTEIACEATRQSILNAALNATSLGGIPSVGDRS